MTSLCAKHPHQPLGGVCASCLSERLAICMGSLGKCEGGGEGESANNEALGSSIILSSNGIGNGPPIASRDTDKRTLSYYLESFNGVSSNCNVHASHRKAISSDAIYQANSFYSAHQYVPQGRDDGSSLKGAKENPSLTMENPSLSSKGRPFSWISVFFSKREEKQKADSRECSIAPWRECSSKDSCTHSFSSEPEQLSPWPKKHTTSPLKLSSLLSSQSTRSPLKLPPPLLSPSMVTASSPLKLAPLRTSPRTPLKVPPLLSYPRSPLKLSSLLSSKPAIACDVESQVEEDQRSGHGVSSVQSKRKEIWLGILMRNKWVVRFKRYFGKKKKQEEAESVRTSSARESDYCRHSQNHHLVQARHSQNHWFMERNQQRSPTLNVRPSRAGREGDWQRWGSPGPGGRDYAGWESYFSNSFNGLQVRHRYHSADSSELLRFYLTPTIRSTYKLRPHHYY